MARLSGARKNFLVEATSLYHGSLIGSPAEEYLAKRGLMAGSVATEVGRFRLGYVAEPLIGHEPYRGMLAIPYLRRSPAGEWTVVSMKFRCLEDHEHRGHGKYTKQAGDKNHLFNTIAIIDNDDTIAITEGELDAITAQACGVPSVGVPGVEAWRPEFRDLFLGYETVHVLADNDEIKYQENCGRCKGECRGHNYGMEFAHRMAEILPNAKIVPMEKGHDVNSMVVTRGKRALLERIK
jgi:hypothetical protein